jgi:hypothetical protein
MKSNKNHEIDFRDLTLKNTSVEIKKNIYNDPELIIRDSQQVYKLIFNRNQLMKVMLELEEYFKNFDTVEKELKEKITIRKRTRK